jgi:WD40 repeat protein
MSRKKKREFLALSASAVICLSVLFSFTCGTSRRVDEARPTILEGYRFPVQALAFSPDGGHLTTAAYFTADEGSEVEVAVWDAGTGQRTAKHTIPPRDLFWLCFAPGGQRFAAIGKDRGVWLGDTASVRRLRDSPAPVLALAFSAEAGLLATADAANVVTLWNVAGGPSRTLCRAVAPVRALAFAADGATLAGGCNDKTVRLWDVATGKEQGVLPGHAHAVVALAFSPDGQTLASGDQRGVVKRWDVAAETEQGALEAARNEGFLNEVSALAFSPDGQTLAVAVESAVQLWDVATGQLVARLEGHQKKVKCLAFAPDGTHLASGGYDQTVRLWDVTHYQAR